MPRGRQRTLPSTARKSAMHGSVVGKKKKNKESQKDKKRELQAKYVAKLSTSARNLAEGA